MKKIVLGLLSVLLVLCMTSCMAAGLANAMLEDEEIVASPTEEEEKSEEAPQTDYAFAEITVADTDACVMKITGCEAGGLFGTEVAVSLENKTDKTLMFAWEDVAVNGYMLDPFWAKEVTAGNKANETLTFSEETMQEYGIDALDEVTFRLRVYNSDDWLEDAFVDEVFTVYLTGKTAEQIEVPARRTAEGEVTVVDNDQYTFVILDHELDDIWGYTLNCYLENKTDDSLMYSWQDVAVNGYMADPYWACEVNAKTRAYAQISFSDSTLEENGITDISEIECNMLVYNTLAGLDEMEEIPVTYQP